jgi:hypothetical protein
MKWHLSGMGESKAPTKSPPGSWRHGVYPTGSRQLPVAKPGVNSSTGCAIFTQFRSAEGAACRPTTADTIDSSIMRPIGASVNYFFRRDSSDRRKKLGGLEADFRTA